MKKQSFTGFTIKLLVLLVIIAVYVNTVYFPLDKKIETVEAEKSSAEQFLDNLKHYSNDTKALETRNLQTDEKIKAQKVGVLSNPLDIDEEILSVLNQTGNTAISISVGDKVSDGKKSADLKSTLFKVNIGITLDINLTANASFVKAMENHKSGAFSVDSIVTTEDSKFIVNMTARFFGSDGAAK